MFGHDRRPIRERFVEVWRKMRTRAPLEPLEALIADVIADHPEYHRLLEDGDDALDRDWTPAGGQANPFLHMGLHIALREQLGTDRPPGIRAAFNALLSRCGERLEAEHLAIECLAESLWQASRDGAPPDEAAYLACLRGRSPTGR
jgi:hypothetical protein